MWYKTIKLLIFVCFAFIWCLPWIRKRLLTLPSLFSFVWGGIAFLSIIWIQIPLQKTYSEALLGSAVPNFFRALGFAGISGFVQEFFKAIGPIIGLTLLKDRLKVNPIVLGVAAGAGFGLVEASVLTWNVPLSFWGVFERFSAICFHVGASALVLYGFQRRRPFLFYVIAALAHGFLNFLIWVFRKGYFSVASLEVLAFIYSLVLFVIVLILTYGVVKNNIKEYESGNVGVRFIEPANNPLAKRKEVRLKNSGETGRIPACGRPGIRPLQELGGKLKIR